MKTIWPCACVLQTRNCLLIGWCLEHHGNVSSYFNDLPDGSRTMPSLTSHHWQWGKGTTRHCLCFKEMTLNKMVWNFWHQFLIRFSMLFQMVPFILLCMVAHLTITWLVETIPTANQRALCWWFLKLPWREKKKGTIWKSNENWVRNWCQKWHTILFTATHRDKKAVFLKLSVSVCEFCFTL